MRNGTQLQASPRLGTAHLGHHQQPELITRLQVPQNAVTNVAMTITGKIRNVSPTQKRMSHAQDFHQMQSGTQLQASPRLGTAHLGRHQQPESTTKPRATPNAVTNAAAAITEKIRNVSPTQKRMSHAQDFRQTHNGTPFQQLHKTGTALLILHQQLECSTRLQALLNVASNARRTTLGQTTQPAKLIKKFQTAPAFRQTLFGTQLQLSRKLGTETTGLQQLPEFTARLQAQANADTSVRKDPLGTDLSVLYH